MAKTRPKRSTLTPATRRPAAKSGVVRMLSRSIKPSVEARLWGRAAGRCEFAGCNQPLWKSSVTQESVNLGQKAHIYAFSAGGPRGHRGVTAAQLNDHDNLLLVCGDCHRKIDSDQAKYTAELLQEWKTHHERRIELVTGIDPGRRSHVLLYGANVGDHTSPLLFKEAAWAMMPDRCPADATPISLGTVDSSTHDVTDGYWTHEAHHLRQRFSQRVADPIRQRMIDHLSVFAIAPQPLLILLGTLLGDLVPADVYQRHREPPTWRWPTNAQAPAFNVREPATLAGRPALVLALSATVTPDRITSVLGDDASVWSVTVREPHNDLIKSRAQLSALRRALRRVLDRIKAAHGQTTELHIFPVGAVSAAVELGRVRMPKADMPWRIYDQVNHRGGFVAALSIPSRDSL